MRWSCLQCNALVLPESYRRLSAVGHVSQHSLQRLGVYAYIESWNPFMSILTCLSISHDVICIPGTARYVIRSQPHDVHDRSHIMGYVTRGMKKKRYGILYWYLYLVRKFQAF